MERRNFLKSALSMAIAAGACRSVTAAELNTLRRQRPYEIMLFTNLSSGATLKAWNNIEYKDDLIKNPDGAIKEFWGDKALGRRLVIHENTNDLYHFTLPHFTTSGRYDKPGELLDQLKYETHNDDSFEFFLPPSVLARALTDTEYKTALLRDPVRALKDMKYIPPSKHVIVHQNDETTHNLTLRANPVGTARLVKFERQLTDYIILVTGQCCASGTCDNDLNNCAACHGARRGEDYSQMDAPPSHQHGWAGHNTPRNGARDPSVDKKSLREISDYLRDINI